MIGDPQEEGEIVGSKSCNQEEDGGERGGGGGGGGGGEVDRALIFSMWVGGGQERIFSVGQERAKECWQRFHWQLMQRPILHMCVSDKVLRVKN